MSNSWLTAVSSMKIKLSGPNFPLLKMLGEIIAENTNLNAKNCESRQLPFPTLLHLQQNQPLESPVQGQYQIVLPQVIPSPSMAGSSQQVSVQRAIGESSVWLQVIIEHHRPSDSSHSCNLTVFYLMIKIIYLPCSTHNSPFGLQSSRVVSRDF